MASVAAVLAVAGLLLDDRASAQTQPAGGMAGKIGAGLCGIGGPSLEFVDAAKTTRSFEAVGAAKLEKDEHGWPKGDATTCVFDQRPTFAWAPPIDDPDRFQMDLSGTYKLSFTGQAKIAPVEDPGSFTVENLKFDEKTNTTTADIVFPKGKGLMAMAFTQTKLTPDAPVGSGFKNLRIIRPGYPADTKQVFTDEYVKALKPFAVLRFMDFSVANNHSKHNGYYPKVIQWTDRKQPDAATQEEDLDRKGAAWEYVIELGNVTGRDIWITVPAEVDDEYVRQLAKLMKENLKPGINIYVEHSNEVWNWMFFQAVYNKVATEAEIAKGGSNLVNDGKKDLETVRARRHARRTMELGNIFREAFGKEQAARIRPVLSWWTIQPGAYAQMLEWINATYGPPKNYFCAVATTGYFNCNKAKMGSVEQILAAMRADADEGLRFAKPITETARKWGLKHFIYEGGPDTGGGDQANVANRIRAERSKEMGEILKHQVRDNLLGAAQVDLFMQFVVCSRYSRYGCWGATEDIRDLNTPKYRALMDLIEKGE
jgi:hypothetical protein